MAPVSAWRNRNTALHGPQDSACRTDAQPCAQPDGPAHGFNLASVGTARRLANTSVVALGNFESAADLRWRVGSVAYACRRNVAVCVAVETTDGARLGAFLALSPAVFVAAEADI